ncbi:MAG TPA: prepilin-type N-terminal cleavage/methylation domain-containing protein [Candidatus Binatia bacterium]|nr:prepilin-type N-terminal cleavage/methylation domain-containing protein [Candidatus Binatia bacterium]
MRVTMARGESQTTEATAQPFTTGAVAAAQERRRGFSLIELLIVVAIILIISAISIPNLLRSRMAANEASAVGSLRTITAACVTYSSIYGIGFPAALSNLGTSGGAGPASADLLDNTLAAGVKSGYVFVYTSSAAVSNVVPAYAVQANPLTWSQTGTRYFFTDQSGVIRFNLSAAASANDSPIS